MSFLGFSQLILRLFNLIANDLAGVLVGDRYPKAIQSFIQLVQRQTTEVMMNNNQSKSHKRD